jgi:hypothetical protein
MLSAIHTNLKEGSLKERKEGKNSCSTSYTPFPPGKRAVFVP